jgi:hypothetical protein
MSDRRAPGIPVRSEAFAEVEWSGPARSARSGKDA